MYSKYYIRVHKSKVSKLKILFKLFKLAFKLSLQKRYTVLQLQIKLTIILTKVVHKNKSNSYRHIEKI